MEFLAALPNFQRDLPVKTAFAWFENLVGSLEGICYYKYPIVGVSGKPDLVFLLRETEPVVVKCFDFRLDQITSINDANWTVSHAKDEIAIDAPALVLDDLVTELKTRFDKVRPLRRRLNPAGVIVFPLISEADFKQRFGFSIPNTVWMGGEAAHKFVVKLNNPLEGDEWRLARSVLQAAIPLTRAPGSGIRTADKIGAAIRMLDADIALLDEQQHKVAIQIPQGPQRIRGLAGTGKTVLLAMKAANIHHHFPDKKILFTFNTQSLYNQARNLVTRFYRFYGDVDPDWDVLNIRHAWGGRSRPGVYYDLTQRQGTEFLNYRMARSRDPEGPFRACCTSAMQHRIDAEYDYVLVDEAQDFPKEFFPVLYRLSRSPHAIYWAYDELQSLSALEIPDPSDLFGKDPEGKSLVSLDVEDDDGMDRDLVLLKSYRCPQRVLMLAHGIGLGIHNPRGAVQMLGDENSWKAVGYILEKGKLTPKEQVVLFRPPENSPSRITDIYTGNQKLVEHKCFGTREQELGWIAASISSDIKEEGVAAEQIVVISLDSLRAKEYMVQLQDLLLENGIPSTIPGLVDDSSEFAEPGRVTLSTVFRAKGNEAPIVYILSFESLQKFVEEIENRNRAFTAISRSKGWVRITGIGNRMKAIQAEIETILADIPRFRFKFPDMEKIRKLDASETTRRRQMLRKAKEAVDSLKSIGPDALGDLNEADRAALIDALRKARK
jgi:superfamily I DNA and RNA helicase